MKTIIVSSLKYLLRGANIKKLNKLNKGREILLYFQDKQRFEKDNITVL